MELLFSLSRWIHIVSGFLALFIFWIPMITRKGSKVHRQIGKLFVIAMLAIAGSAFYMGSYRIIWDSGAGEDIISFSWFLIFIALLSVVSAFHGIRVLRFKSRTTMHQQWQDLWLAFLLVIASIGIMTYGWFIKVTLLTYFPLIGLFLGASQLYYWFTKPKLTSHWVIEHIVGMMSCCIAVITAFIVFGAPRLLQVDMVSLWLWFLPTIIFVPLIIIFTNYYGRKFSRQQSANKVQLRG